ncbi:MAG: MlaD family protein [Candidatus Delongbacteria bacterium]|jgi:phospholipid/cholesterol/gamma-HCH transport system substrate-binding protein|nr:MlaD family protein [Candidatus Delongbacteria bacterium]MDY0018079.1 MlaD family protein [Candidatus Delongbacteria bacterium]
MVTRAQKIRVLTLLAISLIVVFYVLFLLVGKKIMSRNDTYYIKLQKQSVTGLNIGTDVKYYGINIGKVVDIVVNPEDISEIIVTVSVKQGTPIKETATANLSYQSIATGLKQIEITGGDNEDRTLQPEEFIKAGSDLFNDITGKAEIIAQKIESLLNNLIFITEQENAQKFVDLISQLEDDSRKLDTLITAANDFLADNNEELKNILRKGSVMIDNVSDASSAAAKALRNLDKKVQSEELDSSLKDLAEIMRKINSKDLDVLITSLNELVKKSESTVSTIDRTFLQGRNDILRSIELFKETLENINEFAILIRDNPDILIRGKDGD